MVQTEHTKTKLNFLSKPNRTVMENVDTRRTHTSSNLNSNNFIVMIFANIHLWYTKIGTNLTFKRGTAVYLHRYIVGQSDN